MPPRPRAASAASIVAVAGAVVLLAACGSSSGGRAPSSSQAGRDPCPARVGHAVARLVGAPAAHARLETRSAGQITCLYRARAARGGRREKIRVEILSSPQAYSNFQTEIVHREQFLTGVRGASGMLPREIGGIGLDADWIPASHQLLAATGSRYATVTVLSRGAGAPRDLAAAKPVAPAALHGAAKRPPPATGS